MDRNRRWMLRALGGFLAVMVLGTVISRAAASALVAQVETKKACRGRLSYSYEGDGTVIPVQENRIFLWQDQQVEWVAKQGSTVREGECLVQFRMEYLSQSIEKKQAELTQLELQVSQQQISAREQARVPAAAGAGKALSQAQQQLEAARQKEAQAQAAYEQFLWSYPLGESRMKREGITAEGEEEDAEEDGSVAGTGSDADTWQVRKQELEVALREAQADVESAGQAVLQAQDGYELARQEDAASQLNAANASEAARLGAEASKVQAEYTQKELERLQSYQEEGGRICAEQDCTVLQTGVQEGAITSGTEVLVTGSGGFRLKGKVKAADREKFKTGDEAEVRLGSGKKKTVKIESIGMDAEGEDESGGESSKAQAFWTAPLPEHTKASNGDSFTWSMETASDKEYEQIIPLCALREDQNESYCLILAEEEQMLGTVQTAKKVPVTVLEKDGKSAAVTSALTLEDQVITASEKYVTEGDRVRLKE